MGWFMMNNFIKIIQTPTKHGMGGSFSTFATFRLDNFKMLFKNVEVKIDTGCSISMFPMARFRPLRHTLDKLKESDILNNIPYILSYGAESGGKKHKEPVTLQEKMDCEAMKFEHNISNFEIDGVKITNNKVHLNYNRRGNILIGMDILEHWSFYVDTVNNETIFLGCPKDQLNEEYLIELEKTFHLGSKINEAIARNEDNLH